MNHSDPSIKPQPGPSPAGAPDRTIRAGWLIDGSGGPIRRDVLIQIHKGRILSIKQSRPDDTSRPGLVDMSACTIMPGLIDCHVHLFMSGSDDLKVRRFQLDAGFTDLKGVIEKHLQQHLVNGIIAIRDGGDKMAHALRYKTAYRNPKKEPIIMQVAGKAWHRAGRYGRLIGRSPSETETLAIAISKENADGDHVKIVNSGLNSLIKYGHETAPQFDIQELKAAIKAAEVKGLDVMIHANGKAPVAIAIDSGCRSIEHGFFMGRENLKKMAEKNIFWIPTAITMQAYARHLKHAGQNADVARKNLDHQLEQVQAAKKIGVPIALGTDAGSLGVHHGAAVMEELRLLMRAGLSLPEAVRCAALNGARLLNLKELGLLAEGMRATFIATRGDPSNLPESLNSIERILIQGRFYAPEIKTSNRRIC